MKSIATRYGGVQFRSRLEASWAAFFDRLGWRWEYEPFDLDGYVPDFVLLGPAACLVEVKPFGGLDDSQAAAYAEEFERSLERSGYDVANDLALLAGIGVHPVPWGGGYVGVLSDWRGGNCWWAEAIVHRCRACERLAFHHALAWNRSSPCGDDVVSPTELGPYGFSELQGLWRDAKNRVQWKPPR